MIVSVFAICTSPKQNEESFLYSLFRHCFVCLFRIHILCIDVVVCLCFIQKNLLSVVFRFKVVDVFFRIHFTEQLAHFDGDEKQ